MSLKNRFQKIKKVHLQIAGVLLLILIAAGLLWFNYSTSWQSLSPMHIELYFEGDYRIADGPWMPYVAGEHIPATKGDVTLRGNLYKRYEDENLGVYNSDDLPAAFYTNHINLTFFGTDENGEKIQYVTDHENPLFGDSACGEVWSAGRNPS